MAKRGKAAQALGTAVIGSFVGDVMVPLGPADPAPDPHPSFPFHTGLSDPTASVWLQGSSPGSVEEFPPGHDPH
jgi:hypothetical protein